MNRVLTFGETMGLASSRDFGGFIFSPEARIGFGGAESNVAIGLARLGADVTWASCLGADLFGQLITRELRAEGITTLIRIDPVRNTGFMIKERNTPTDTTVLYYRAGSAASYLNSTDLPLDRITDWDLLHVTGITPALSRSAQQATREAIHAAHAAHVPVSLDFNYRSSLWSRQDAADFLLEVLPACHIVFAGGDEARLLLDDEEDPIKLAAHLVHLGAQSAVIKLGALGAVANVEGVTYKQAAIHVPAVVDTVGAGDSFTAGYLAEMLAGQTPADSLLTAVTVAALTCQSPGDWEGAATRAQLGRNGDPVRR